MIKLLSLGMASPRLFNVALHRQAVGDEAGGPLTDKSRVYIVAPAKLARGGPELLHQLAYKLQQRDMPVSMFYLPNDYSDPVHSSYRNYGVTCVRTIEDKQENVLIVPETMTEFLSNYQHIRKAIWWLSVDNYFVEQETH